LKPLVLFLAIALTGCAIPNQNPPLPRMPFPEAEYSTLPKSGTGTATVRGQAFLKTRGGDVKTAAGNQVFLNPVTSYSIEWYEKSYLPNRPIQDADTRVVNYIPTQIADGSGHFVFKNVPAGEYFVSTNVTWEAPTGYQGALQVQGGRVAKRIKVSATEEVEVIVTK
jgi:hypothetical protein